MRIHKARLRQGAVGGASATLLVSLTLGTLGAAAGSVDAQSAQWQVFTPQNSILPASRRFDFDFGDEVGQHVWVQGSVGIDGTRMVYRMSYDLKDWRVYPNLRAAVESNATRILASGQSVPGFWTVQPPGRIWIDRQYFDGRSWRELGFISEDPAVDQVDGPPVFDDGGLGYIGVTHFESDGRWQGAYVFEGVGGDFVESIPLNAGQEAERMRGPILGIDGSVWLCVGDEVSCLSCAGSPRVLLDSDYRALRRGGVHPMANGELHIVALRRSGPVGWQFALYAVGQRDGRLFREKYSLPDDIEFLESSAVSIRTNAVYAVGANSIVGLRADEQEIRALGEDSLVGELYTPFFDSVGRVWLNGSIGVAVGDLDLLGFTSVRGRRVYLSTVYAGPYL